LPSFTRRAHGNIFAESFFWQYGKYLGAKSISSRLRPPRPNPAVILAGLDENQAWGAANIQPAPQLYARKSAFLTYFYK
jgi:hypothetical protein